VAELTIDQALQQGIEAHKAGQIQEADRLYAAILKAQPKHPDANHNMGVLAVGVGKVEEALPFFKTALEANPAIAQFWLSYIDALIKLDKLADAKAVLDQAKSKGAKGDGFDKLEQRLKEASEEPLAASKTPAEAPPKQPNILDSLKLDQALKLANKKAKDGSPEEAKRVYQDILATFPKNKRASDGLKGLTGKTVGKASKGQNPSQDQLEALITLYSQGQLQQALKQAETLVQQFPQSAILFNIQGVVLKGLGQLELSVGAYNKALAIKPDYAEAYYNMGITLQEQGKLEEAIEAYNKSLAIKPDYAEAYNNLGATLQEQGKLEEAIDAYNKALAIKPDYAEAYYNMGITLQELGKLEEAIEAYNKALAIKPDYAEAYYNMGITLQEQGKLEEAIEAYNKSLAIKPDYAEAYNNLGATLQEQGKLEEAIDAYNKALAIKPDYAEAYNNMGITLQELGKLEEAIEAYNKALAIKPDYAEAYYNMGITLKELGKLEEAIEAYNKSLAIKPDYAEAYYNMGNALRGGTFKRPNLELQETIGSLLDQKNSARPKDIAAAAISLLKFEANLQKHQQTTNIDKTNQSLQQTVLELSDLSLLLKLMSICPLNDLGLEALLKEIRAGILFALPSFESTSDILQFQSALALQCFTNEYIYEQNEDEEKAINVLENSVEVSLSKGEQPSPKAILCLASYKALHEYKWCDLLSANKDITQVFTRQVSEPRLENQLKSNMPMLEEITDDVSVKVRAQYEDSPYPRWVNLGLPLNPESISKVVAQLKIKLFNTEIREVSSPDILVAGCGTGQHSIGTATTFKNSKVLAIDLSLSSLAYAKRKTEELGVTNINYMQADILKLQKLDRQFDIIESAGVLHHMDSPMAGWKVLVDCLRDGGLMNIGLYSELARQPIVEMRKEISQSGIGTSDIALKSFRTGVITSDLEHHNQIVNSSDFYSLSTLRDLLFHVQEHRFTISQLKQCLEELGLKFCGFNNDSIVKKFSVSNAGANDPYDLDKWQTYEESNPRAFVGMYQFWCQKIA
jgi:tetratricopeptide (TPR) repeat protein/SAM-dependent methyltransferase